jgi:Polyketide cyclase / dehydrase and lipid transport
MLGRRLVTLVEVTALEPGARFAFTGVTGPFTAHNDYTFESVAGGTRVTDSAESELSGLIRLIDPLVGRMMHRQFEANLGALKERLESARTTPNAEA